MSADITLQVDHNIYEGWESLQIQRGIEQLAGAYQLTCADRWALQNQPLPDLKGKSASVSLNDIEIITGFIDAAAPRYSGDEHMLVINGRDATADLVDSCASTTAGGWLGRSLKQIALSLCKPFGISVTVDPSCGKDADLPFQFQQLQVGETCFEALSRLARLRGVLLITDRAGGLLITRAAISKAKTVLRLRENILAADGVDNDQDRFNEYRVVAQARESDHDEPTETQQIGHSLFDSSIRKGRLLIIDPVDATDIAGCQRLATWTRSQRAARSKRTTFTIRGWLDDDQPWWPNTLVAVDDPWSRFDGEYLIATVTNLQNEGGRLTQLEVVPPEAYSMLPQKEIDPADAKDLREPQ